MDSHRVWYLLLIGATCASWMGCDDRSATTDRGALSAPRAERKSDEARQGKLRPREDRSLEAIDYVQSGLPAPDRSWSGSDMAKAADVFAEIASDDAGKLPRYDSDRSGEVFARMLDKTNLEHYGDPSLPVEQRLRDCGIYIHASNEIAELYLESHRQGDSEGSEFIEMMGSQLRVAVVLLRLADEVQQRFGESDSAALTQVTGKAKAAAAGMFAGSLEMLPEGQTYQTSVLKRLIRCLQETAPEILPRLSAEVQTETLNRLRTFANNPAMQNLNPELAEFASEMEAAFGKAASRD